MVRDAFGVSSSRKARSAFQTTASVRPPRGWGFGGHAAGSNCVVASGWESGAAHRGNRSLQSYVSTPRIRSRVREKA
ncbi:hypothetical protein BN903_89 [Halorubrum sp. AJ67]|nr:hypothetical protein BN903_89 [Halorubrum sp. AJ67]